MVTNVLRQLTTTAVTVVLVVVKAPLLLFFAAFIPGGMAQFVSSFLVTRHVIPHLPSFRGRGWAQIAASSVPYVLAMAVNVIYFRAAMLAMSLLGEPRETGYFGVSFRIIETLMTLTAFVLASALPLLTRTAVRDPARYTQTFKGLVQVSVLVGSGLAVTTVTGAPLAIEIFGGPAFEPATELLQMMALTLLLKFLTTALGFGLLARDRYRAVLVSNLCALAAVVVVSVIAIPPMGGVGAALASIAAEAVLASSYLVCLRGDVRALKPAMPASVAVVAIATVASAVRSLSAPPLVLAVLGPLVFTLLVIAVGAIPQQLVSALPGVPAVSSRRLGR
jgi:O-antigen/teichoic acid export membrane protein